MSAICGVYYLNKKPVTTEIIQQMTDALGHRGGDGTQIWFDGSVGLGHQMWHTTPESANESLPFATKECRYVITADARIDNREDLFSVLSIRSVKRQFMPDSHLIIYAYNKWGEDCANYLQGDFVFALWDSKEERLFCATDPMGSRQFKVYQSGEVFAFASEAKSILTLPEVKMELNEAKLASSMIIALRSKVQEHTFFKNIFNLPPATTITVLPHKVVRFNYWEPTLNNLEPKDDEEYFKTFRELLFNSIKNRMHSKFPVAISLSGGLDSSALTCIASRITKHHFRPFFVVSSVSQEEYQGGEFDNRYFIRSIQEREEIQVKQVTPRPEDVFSNLEQLFFQSEAPIVSHNHYMYSRLYQTAAENEARIILDGRWGEIGPSFIGCGYLAEIAKQWQLLQLIKEVSRIANSEGKKFWEILVRDVLSILFPKYFKPAQFAKRSGNDVRSTVIHPQFFKKMELAEHYIDSNTTHRPRMLPNIRHNLLRAVQAGLANTDSHLGIPSNINVLYPFKDKKLIEFCLSIPGRLFNNGEWTRFLIRAGLEEMLPQEIQWQKEKLKSSPDHHYFLQQNWQVARDIVNSVKSGDIATEYVDIGYLKKTLELYKNKSSWEPVNGHDPARFVIQTGVHMIQFLEWFKNFKPTEIARPKIKTVEVEKSGSESQKAKPVAEKPKAEQKLPGSE